MGIDRDEFRQVMDDYNQQSPAGGGQDTESELIVIGFIALLVFGAILGAAAWLDQEFHWHLVAWIKDHLGIN